MRCGFVPGVEVARLGGPGQQTSLFVRGTESNHVLVLMDGLRINPGTIGTAAIQNIAPEFVERVEVVKGPRSTLYGSDAIGGVINVITRRGADEGGSVQAGFGSFDTQSASLSAGIGGERAEASFGASWIESDGFPTRTGDTTDRGYENTVVHGIRARGCRPGRARRARLVRLGHDRSTRTFSSRRSTRTSRIRHSRFRRNSRPRSPGTSRLTAAPRDRRPRAEPVRRFPRYEAQYGRLAERHRCCRNTRPSPRACCGRTRKPMPNPSDLPYAADTTTSQFYRPGPGRRSVRTGCCSAPPTPITRPSAATRPGTWSTDSSSQAARSSPRRRARDFARRTRPISTDSAGIRTSMPRSR